MQIKGQIEGEIRMEGHKSTIAINALFVFLLQKSHLIPLTI